MPKPYNFPIVAALAPVLGSALIWALTRSPFALVFALLGPLVAVASVADARLQARRLRRTESVRFLREVTATRAAIAAHHERERSALLRACPAADDLRGVAPNDPERWRTATVDASVRLGLGRAESTAQLEGMPPARAVTDDPSDLELESLREDAAALTGVPVSVDARLGIGVCGPAALSSAVARGILLQLSALFSPAEMTVAASSSDGVVPAAEAEWLGALPHGRGPSPPPPGHGFLLDWQVNGQRSIVAVALRVEDLPTTCRVVVRVGAGRAAVVARAPGRADPEPIVAEFVSAEQAVELAGLLAAAAKARGVDPAGIDDGWVTDFASLPVPVPPPGAGTLSSVFCRSAEGPLAVDLVVHGPHAVVGGTTGSGKSELLVSWILAMAVAHPPTAVCFLLVDFKGGSSFAPIRGLPHVVGVVTDLDERAAHRAMISLRAELRFRERVLAEAGARTIGDPGVGLPRLVIVVDEFAAMASEFPELHDLFADLAARGRSLGLHLVLCTQRPAGVIRDAVLANATLRLSLRVNNRADSVAVLGSGVAAELPGDAPGRALMSIGADAPRLVQVAQTTAADVSRVAGRHPAVPGGLRRPWCDDLPAVVPLSTVANPASLSAARPGIPFGLLDLPELQRQETATYDPAHDGNLLVIGGQRSGKTGLLATLARHSGAQRVPSTIDGAWDTIVSAVEHLRAGRPGARLLLADDLDALITRFPDEHEAAFVDRLVELAREGSSVGLHLVLAVRRVPPALQTLASLCDCRVVLRMPNRQDHLLAGGSVSGFVLDASPGAGEWRGSRLQVAQVGPEEVVPDAGAYVVPEVPAFSPDGHRMTAVVTSRVAEFARRLRLSGSPFAEVLVLGRGVSAVDSHGGGVSVVDARGAAAVVGSPDDWQANWSTMAAARSGGLVVFDRCSVAEFRAISGRRALPPPIRPGADQCWALEPDGSVCRMAAPGA